MKLRISSLMKRLWPLAAFAAAACLLVAFIHSQRAATQEDTPDELRHKRYEAAVNYVRKLSDAEFYPDALGELEKIFDEFADILNPHLYLEAAEFCLKVSPRKADRALEHIDKFLALCPDDADFRKAFEIRGEALFEKKLYSDAIKAYRKSIEGAVPGRRNAHIYGRIGRCYYYLGDFINAERFLDDEMNSSVDYRGPCEAGFILGEICAERFARLKKTDYADQAVAHFWRIFDDKVNPDLRYAARVRIGDLYLALGKYREAEEAYLAALDAVLPVEDMRRWIKSGEYTNTRDDLLRLHVFGRPRTFSMRGDKVVTRPATKMQAMLHHYHESGHVLHEIEILKKMAAALSNKQQVFLKVARKYDDLCAMVKGEIEKIDARLRTLRGGLSGRMNDERIFRAEQELKEKKGLLDEYLRLAALYYERGFNEDPYSGATFKVREHALWKAGHRMLERRDYIGAERVLLRITKPELKFEKEMVLKSQLILGGMYRDLGRSEEALETFRNVIEEGKEEGAQIVAAAAYEEAVTLAAMGRDEAAEKAFSALMRDDNPYGIGIYSKIWRNSAFALGGIKYRVAIAADGGRERKLKEVVVTLTDALDRYKSFIDEETRDRSLYYLGDSLNHLALLAESRGENDKARALFSRAGGFLGRIGRPAGRAGALPVFYRNSRLLYAGVLASEGGIVSDPDEKQKLMKMAGKEYALISKTMEGTEQGLWALIQMGRMAHDAGDRSAAARCFELAAAGIEKLRKENAFANNPGGFDADYLQKILDWLRNKNFGG